MIENYYCGKVVYCTKSGYKIIESLNGEKTIDFTAPILKDTGYRIVKKDEDKYIDIQNNKKYEKFGFNSTTTKGRFYIKDIVPMKKILKELGLKEKMQMLKTMMLIESSSKIGELVNINKEESCKVLAKKMQK